jgi:NADPH:quinone reductase-like Zn-dependent oxidoreductase
VVAAARAGERLQRTLDRGADAVVELDTEPDLAAALQEATGGADVIVDPLWGEPGLAAMKAAAHGGRHVEVGQMADAALELPAPLVRAKALNVLGFALASFRSISSACRCPRSTPLGRASARALTPSWWSCLLDDGDGVAGGHRATL